MSYEFKTIDNFAELNPDIYKFLPRFIENRVTDRDQLAICIQNSDFQGIRDICHKILGVALSYNCSRMDEIMRDVQKYARTNEMDKIKELFNSFSLYINDLSKTYPL